MPKKKKTGPKLTELLQFEAEEQLRETRNGNQFKCERCGKWRSFDQGHSEGNECVEGWAEIEAEIIAFVASALWRAETSIVWHICKQEPTLNERRVEAWLAELVEVAGKLEWFTRASEEKMGTRAYCSEPLRYRIKTKKEKKDGSKRSEQRSRNQRAVRKLQAQEEKGKAGRRGRDRAQQTRRASPD